MTRPPVPAWQLYGERTAFPDVAHAEAIVDRAAGLDWTIAPHRHPHLHQMFLLTSGMIRMRVDGAPWEPAPPVVLNLPRGVVHSFTFSAGTEGTVVTLPADEHADLLAPAAAPVLARPFRLPATPALTAAFATLTRRHATSHVLRPALLRAAATALLAEMAEAALHAGLAPAGDATQDTRIQRLEDLVRRHMRQGWGIAAYADALALSPRHLSRLCTTATGLNAKAFVEALILREACRLLVYTRMSVQQIGFQTGFDDPSYFSRAFHRRIGLAPRAYRQMFEVAPAANAG
jgi:AraC family transcriptional activator of pobA